MGTRLSAHHHDGLDAGIAVIEQEHVVEYAAVHSSSRQEPDSDCSCKSARNEKKDLSNALTESCIMEIENLSYKSR